MERVDYVEPTTLSPNKPQTSSEDVWGRSGGGGGVGRQMRRDTQSPYNVCDALDLDSMDDEYARS
jgi:hypothetical protein